MEELEVTDIYGFQFTCTADQQRQRQQCEVQQVKRAAKWAKYAKQRQLPAKDQLKRFCRKGVPPQYRPWVWTELAGATGKSASQRKREQIANYYEAMVHMGESTSEFAHQIELDLPRTYPGNVWLAGEEGQAALRRVLLAFSVHKPEVGYCQSMNYLAALLLLALERCEEDAFWVLVSLIDDGGILYKDMYAANLVGAHVEMQSLGELVALKLPRLHRHLAALSCDMSIIATDWFLCLFSTSLPSEAVARVWDALLNEGPKILFRTALALLKLHEEALLALDNPGEILRYVRTATAGVHDRDTLMKVAFDGIGSMPMAKIATLREAKQEVVESELRRRENRHVLAKALSAQKISADAGARDSLGQPDEPLPNVHSSHGLSALAERVKAAYSRRSAGNGLDKT